MRAQGLPISTVTLLVIVLIAVALGLVFAFTYFSEGKNQTESITGIGEQGTQVGISAIEESFFSINCDTRCNKAKTITKTGTISANCYDSEGEPARVQGSNFCDDTLETSTGPIFCDEYYKLKGKACELTFSDGKRELYCDEYVEKC